MPDVLLIGVDDWATGQRGGGVIDLADIRDGSLLCRAGPLHQRLEHHPGGDFEFRVVRDGRDLTQYDGTWTVHFDDGSTATTKPSVVDAVRNQGRSIVDVDGVVPIPDSQLSQAIDILRVALLPQYGVDGDPQDVRDWASGQTPPVELTGTPYEKLEQAHEAGCPFVDRVDPPETFG